MTSQKCPKCFSNRVRRGYRPTPFWSKVLFRYNLLCDNCNWEFRGWAVPGTVSSKPTKKPKKNPVNKTNNSFAETSPDADTGSNNGTTNFHQESTENAVSLDNFAGQGVKAQKKGQG